MSERIQRGAVFIVFSPLSQLSSWCQDGVIGEWNNTDFKKRKYTVNETSLINNEGKNTLGV